MFKQQIHFVVALAALTVVIAGCGGGNEPSPRGDVVIEPQAQPAAGTSAEPAAAPAGDAIAAAQATAPAETPAASAEESKPEMKADQPASSTEIAAAPAEQPAATEAPAAAEEQPADEQKPADAAAASADKGTTFKGRIVVKGDVPATPPIKPSGSDPYCINLGEIPNDEVVVGEGNGLADVFVWLRKAPSGVEVPPPPTEPAILDQKGCRFIPPAMVVQVGQPLLVKNDDATLHNTRMSGLTISFNQTVGPNNREGVPVPPITRPEIVPVPVQCDIHSWMSARILATDNPWFAVSDKDGNFEINNLPAGTELEFRIQHGKAGYVERSLKLTLKEGEVKEQSFEVDASKLAG
jgi:hypothetical protein